MSDAPALPVTISEAAGQARDLARAVLRATFTPLRLLATWRAAPAGAVPTGRLIGLYVTLAGASLYLGSKLGWYPELDQLVAPARASNPYVGATLDAWWALMPAIIVWAQLVGARSGGRAIAGTAGRAVARRYAAFLACVYLVATPVHFALGVTLGQGLAMIGSVLLSLVYGAIGFRGLLAVSWRRSVAGALLADLIASAVVGLYSMLGGLVAGLATAGRPPG